MKIFSIFLLWFALSCDAQSNGKNQQLVTRDVKDAINATVGGVLVKNGQLTSCSLAVIDSKASVVAASCLDYSSDKAVDKNTKLEVIFSAKGNTKNPLTVDSVTVHPKFNPSNHVNDIAILQYKNNNAAWQARLASTIGDNWDKIAYAYVAPNNVTNSKRNVFYGTTGVSFDDTCDKMSEMFATNIDDMLCTSLIADLPSKNLSECVVPMGVAYGIINNTAYLLGPYSFTAVSGGNGLCAYANLRNYYTGLSRYAGFIQETIERQLIWSSSLRNNTDMHYNSSFTMVDSDFVNDNGMHLAKIGGNFFKHQANNSDIDLAARADKGTVLSHREIVILAVCISVGGAIIVILIVFIVWRRRWRNSNMVDPVDQNIIETEIGGAIVPAYALNGPVSRAQSPRESVADCAPTYLQSSTDNEQISLSTHQDDLPPTYNDVIVERSQTAVASAEIPDMKKNNE